MSNSNCSGKFVCNLNGPIDTCERKKYVLKVTREQKKRGEEKYSQEKTVFTFDYIPALFFIHSSMNHSRASKLARNWNLGKFLSSITLIFESISPKKWFIFILLTCWHTFQPSHVKSQQLIDNPNFFLSRFMSRKLNILKLKHFFSMFF